MPNRNDGDDRTPAGLIAAQAVNFEASVLKRAAGQLLVEVRLRRTGGEVVDYQLTVEARTPAIQVRESEPRHLPPSCPDRHINPDGTFCMNWQTADPVRVDDAEGAEQWWAILLQYLKLQERARRLGRWPSRRQWAHGDAARHQSEAEACAAVLGDRIGNALAAGRLVITRHPGRTAFVTLQDGDRRLYSVWTGHNRVVTQRQACLCGSGRPLRRCSDHAARAADLVSALERWRKADAAFWRAARSLKCCGTLEQCPLRDLHAVVPPPPIAHTQHDLAA